MLAVNLFHMRGGKMVDRREFFWGDLPEFATAHLQADRPQIDDVGTAAPGDPNEQSSPARLAEGDIKGGETSQASLGKDSRGRLSPHDPEPVDSSFSPGEFFSALLKQL